MNRVDGFLQKYGSEMGTGATLTPTTDRRKYKVVQLRCTEGGAAMSSYGEISWRTVDKLVEEGIVERGEGSSYNLSPTGRQRYEALPVTVVDGWIVN